MFYEIQILLIVILFMLGSYELLQLTTLGSWISSLANLLIKQFYSLILTKKHGGIFINTSFNEFLENNLKGKCG